MSRILLALAIFGLVACDHYLPDEQTSTLVEGTVVSTSIESFNGSGAVAGAIVGHMLFDGGLGGTLIGGAIGGSAGARGCQIVIKYPSGYAEELGALNAQCKAFKAGDKIQVTEVTRMSFVERNGTKVEVGRSRYRQL